MADSKSLAELIKDVESAGLRIKDDYIRTLQKEERRKDLINTLQKEAKHSDDDSIGTALQKLRKLKSDDINTYDWLLINHFILQIGPAGWAMDDRTLFDKFSAVCDFYSTEPVRLLLEKPISPDHVLRNLTCIMGKNKGIAIKWAERLADEKYGAEVIWASLEAIDKLLIFEPSFEFDRLIPYMESPHLMRAVRDYIMAICDSPERFNEGGVADKLEHFNEADPSSDFGIRYEKLLGDIKQISPFFAEYLNTRVSRGDHFFPSRINPLLSKLEENRDDAIALGYMIFFFGMYVGDPQTARDLASLERKMGAKTDDDGVPVFRFLRHGEIPGWDNAGYFASTMNSVMDKFGRKTGSAVATKSFSWLGRVKELDVDDDDKKFPRLMDKIEGQDFEDIIRLAERSQGLAAVLNNIFYSYNDLMMGATVDEISLVAQTRIPELGNFARAANKSDYTAEEKAVLIKKFSSPRVFRDTLEKAERYMQQGKAATGCANPADLFDMSILECPYEVLRFLGKGASGKVYLVRSKDLDKKRALKVIDLRKASRMEARTLALFEDNPHKNFPQVYEAGTHLATSQNAQVYSILMEHVDGETINRRFEKERVVDCTAQILDGITHLRRIGIFHRDLRPDNILVTKDGTIKIIDFGIASDLDDKPKDNRRYGGNTDLFSLGLIAYKMATGEHLLSPHEAMSTESYAKRIAKLKGEMLDSGVLKGEYKSRIKANVPTDLQGVVIDCLSEGDNDSLIDKVNAGILKAKAGLKQFKDTQANVDYSSRSQEYGKHVKIYKEAALQLKTRNLFGILNPQAAALDIACGEGDSATCFKEFEEKDGVVAAVKAPLVKSVEYFDNNRDMVGKGAERGQVEEQNAKFGDAREGLNYPNSSFDYAISRFFVHDLNPEQKKFLAYDVKRILKPGGKFQVVEMLAGDSETSAFVSHQHSMKTKTIYRECWIPTEDEYVSIFRSLGFADIKTDRHFSYVDTMQWLLEKQITEERFNELNELFMEAIKNRPAVRDYFNLRESGNGSILVDYPLLLICGTKPEK